MRGVASLARDAEDESMRTPITACTLLFTCILACGPQSSSPEGQGGGAAGASGGEGAGAGGSGGDPGGGGGSTGPGGGTANGPPPTIVFNEVMAVGSSEWIEIVNSGAAAADLSNYAIAGSVKTSSEPKTGDAMKFPAGTMVEPGARIVILTSRKDEPVGPHQKASCLPDGPETCFYAPLGVSATSGEALHFLAPDGTVVTTTAVPATLSADAGGSTSESQ